MLHHLAVGLVGHDWQEGSSIGRGRGTHGAGLGHGGHGEVEGRRGAPVETLLVKALGVGFVVCVVGRHL